MSTTTPVIASNDLSLWQATVILRYLAVSVYVVLVLEHLASFPLEVEFVWKAPGNLVRICFLSYRYGSLFGLAILTYLVLWMRHCRQALAAVAALSVFTMGIADALVMLRVSVLWGRQRFILVLLLISFAATFSTAVVCVVIVAMRLNAHTVVAPSVDVNNCHFPGRPNAVFGIWIPGMFFDTLVLSLTAWNACARPRTRETALTSTLYRDGALVFVILAGLRSVNLFMSIFSNVFLLTVCIAWPLSAITLSRFIFGLHSLEKEQASASNRPSIEFQHADTESIPCSTLGAPGYSQGFNTTASHECRRGRLPWRNDNLKPPLQRRISKGRDDGGYRETLYSTIGH